MTSSLIVPHGSFSDLLQYKTFLSCLLATVQCGGKLISTVNDFLLLTIHDAPVYENPCNYAGSTLIVRCMYNAVANKFLRNFPRLSSVRHQHLSPNTQQPTQEVVGRLHWALAFHTHVVYILGSGVFALVGLYLRQDWCWYDLLQSSARVPSQEQPSR